MRRERRGFPCPGAHYHILAIYYHIFYIYSSFFTSCLGINTITNYPPTWWPIHYHYHRLFNVSTTRLHPQMPFFLWFYARLSSSKYHAWLTQPNYSNFLHDNSINGRARRSLFLLVNLLPTKTSAFWGLGLTNFMDEEQILRYYDSHFEDIFIFLYLYCSLDEYYEWFFSLDLEDAFVCLFSFWYLWLTDKVIRRVTHKYETLYFVTGSFTICMNGHLAECSKSPSRAFEQKPPKYQIYNKLRELKYNGPRSPHCPYRRRHVMQNAR
jgi:hypothetical protein